MVKLLKCTSVHVCSTGSSMPIESLLDSRWIVEAWWHLLAFFYRMLLLLCRHDMQINGGRGDNSRTESAGWCWGSHVPHLYAYVLFLGVLYYIARSCAAVSRRRIWKVWLSEIYQNNMIIISGVHFYEMLSDDTLWAWCDHIRNSSVVHELSKHLVNNNYYYTLYCPGL